MKRVLFILVALFLGSYMAMSQEYIYGIAPGGERSITANGLSQIYAVSGKYFLSADGAGALGPYTIDVNKPNAGATVYKAILMGASTGFSGYVIPNGCVLLAGTPISWDATIPSGIGSYNHYADVTALIAANINPAGAGITSLTVTECSYYDVDGVALLVIFSDPATTDKTIVIMFGACSTSGDNFSITLGDPIDPSASGALFNMGLGISFGAYGPCGGQRSIVDINSQRLTSSAGGEDDGSLSDGALITVGGIGDLNTNPPDPNSWSSCDIRYDDELYSLLPFITNTTTNILVNTLNPSNDDNIFLSYFEISGAAIIGEGILISQVENVNIVGTDHTVTALVQDDNGQPVVGTMVDFTVLSGPNAGTTYSEVTDASGDAFFTYSGSGGVGTDVIQACFTNSLGVYVCSNLLYKEWIVDENVPVSNWAIVIGIMLILAFAVIRFRR